MHDIIVVGAGPAGLQAARVLSERGFDTLVLEEHDAVGRPVHCTGIVARDAFDTFDLPSDAILNPLTAATFVSPSGRDFTYRPDRLEAVVVDRAAFDARLAERARRAGAQIRCSTRVFDVNCGGDVVSIVTSPGSVLRARACVLACGARYRLHRELGLERPALLLHTAQAVVPA